jgi:two-component system KDP operon response regulator KdpE
VGSDPNHHRIGQTSETDLPAAGNLASTFGYPAHPPQSATLAETREDSDVDDDTSVREALSVGLKLQWQDVEVLEAADGETGLERFFEDNPDLILLDVSMPRMSGFEVLREIRMVSEVPVIMLTGRGDEMDHVRGLELGADEYLQKPIRHAALVAHIKSALRRAKGTPPLETLPDFVAGDLTIHFQNHEVAIAGEVVKVTPLEYRLLYHLVRNAGNVLPHEALLDRVWGSEHEVGPEYLKVFVSRLRSKLRRAGGPDYIQTERGVGYRFLKTRPATSAPSRDESIGGAPPPAVWLAIDRIDPSPAARNSRRKDSRARLQQLADSIREHGVLEPILVVPSGTRYQVVAGNRRLHAAVLAGLDRIAAIVLADLDEQRYLLVNLVENAQRVDLKSTERIAAVRQLAATGLGVREIARGTGLSPATVSRWIRLGGNQVLVQALEEGRIDLFRAMCLAGVSDPDLLSELIDAAPRYSHEDFYALVQQRSVAQSNTGRATPGVNRQLNAIADRLARNRRGERRGRRAAPAYCRAYRHVARTTADPTSNGGGAPAGFLTLFVFGSRSGRRQPQPGAVLPWPASIGLNAMLSGRERPLVVVATPSAEFAELLMCEVRQTGSTACRARSAEGCLRVATGWACGPSRTGSREVPTRAPIG